MKSKLKQVAPNIKITTIWSPDPFSGPISEECDGFDPSEDGDWCAWQSEVRATAIESGEEITGSDHLGGTFERVEDDPEFSNPDISGYYPQMVDRALEELGTLAADPDTLAQIEAGRKVCHDEMRAR